MLLMDKFRSGRRLLMFLCYSLGMINTITYGLNPSQLAARGYGASAEFADQANKSGASDSEGASNRTVRDTIDISGEGQKIINLARGGELASALPDARVDRDAFNAALERAQEDIKRITTLYGAVLSPATSALTSFLQEKANEKYASAESAGDAEFNKLLSAAFNDIRRITDDVGQTLQEKTASNDI